MSITVKEVEDLLPQTQCRQCGFGGCKPYAQALVDKKTSSVSLCKPGGDAVATQLSQLLSMPSETVESWPGDLVANVNVDACIGCSLCQNVCPTEAFIGAAGHLHQVRTSLCHGCQLCLSHCPTECLSLVKRTTDDKPSITLSKERYVRKMDKKLKTEKDKLFSHHRATAELRKPQVLISQCIKKAKSKQVDTLESN